MTYAYGAVANQETFDQYAILIVKEGAKYKTAAALVCESSTIVSSNSATIADSIKYAVSVRYTECSMQYTANLVSNCKITLLGFPCALAVCFSEVRS